MTKKRLTKITSQKHQEETEESIIKHLQKPLLLDSREIMHKEPQDHTILGIEKMEICHCNQTKYNWDEQWETKCSFVNDETILMNAVISGSHKKISELLKDDAMVDKINTNIAGFTPLMMAARKGHQKIVSKLISSGALINFQTEKGTALTEASQNGHTKVVSILLRSGANIEPIALTMASLEGHLDTASFLIGAGADVDEFTYPGTALFTAAFGGHLKVVKCLLEAGALIRNAFLRRRYYGFRTGTSVLVAASSRGHSAVVKLLLEHTDVNSVDQNGWTELIHASASGLDNLVSNLLIKDSPLEASSTISCKVYGIPFFKGTTALIAASRTGSKSVVEVLLKSGASLDVADQKGNTALTEASRNGHRDIVSLLLRAYIEPCLHQKLGVSALLFASSSTKKRKSRKRASLKSRNNSPKKARLHAMELAPSPAPCNMKNAQVQSQISNVEAFLKEWVQKTCGSIVAKYQELVEYFIAAKLSTDCIETVTSSLIASRVNEENEPTEQDSKEEAKTEELKPTTILCCVCLENPKSVVILPCKHLCLCEMCATADIEACPMCRNEIEDYLCVFT